MHPESRMKEVLSKPVDDPVNSNQSRDATGQQERRCHESGAQSASRIEPAVASERHHDIPLKIGSLPPRKAAPDFSYHGYFKKATADSA
jgi:hypothetical protein